jgi:hypothetical protein
MERRHSPAAVRQRDLDRARSAVAGTRSAQACRVWMYQHADASLPEPKNTPSDTNSIAPGHERRRVTRASSGKTDWLNTATLVRVLLGWLRGERGHYANGRDPDERRGRCQAPEP